MATKVKNISTQLLSNYWGKLSKMTFDLQLFDGSWQRQKREVYDKGDGAAILLYNSSQQKVILTKQFRVPAYLNQDSDGFLIEVCAGMLDGNDPETAIIKEVEEETGYQISQVTKVMDVFMTPGAVTERTHFFIAPYSRDDKKFDGGGDKSESEDIQVLEYAFAKAYNMILTGEIKDAKTVILLQFLKLEFGWG